MKRILPFLAFAAADMSQWTQNVLLKPRNSTLRSGGPSVSASTIKYCGDYIGAEPETDSLKEMCLNRDKLMQLFDTIEFVKLTNPETCGFIAQPDETVCAVCEHECKCSKAGAMDSVQRYERRGKRRGNRQGDVIVRRVRFKISLVTTERLRNICVFQHKRNKRFYLKRQCGCCTSSVEACCLRNGAKCKANACWAKPEPVFGQFINQGTVLIEDFVKKVQALPEGPHSPKNWKQLDMSGTYLKDAEQNLGLLLEICPNVEKIKLKACGLRFPMDKDTFQNQKNLVDLDISENGINCIAGALGHLLSSDGKSPILKKFNGDWNPFSGVCKVTGSRRKKALGSKWDFNLWLTWTKNRYGAAWSDDLKNCIDNEPGCTGVVDMYDPDMVY